MVIAPISFWPAVLPRLCFERGRFEHGVRGGLRLADALAEQGQRHRPVVRVRCGRGLGGGRRVGLDDVVYADVAPAAFAVVVDLDDCRSAREVADVQRGGFHGVVFAARGPAHDLPVYQQSQPDFFDVVPAADEKGKVITLDRERGTRQRPDRLVLLLACLAGGGCMGVDDAAADAADIALVLGDVRSQDGAAPERLAGRRPGRVSVPLEVVYHDVRAGFGVRRRRGRLETGGQDGRAGYVADRIGAMPRRQRG